MKDIVKVFTDSLVYEIESVRLDTNAKRNIKVITKIIIKENRQY